jgi:hypothetical protein
MLPRLPGAGDVSNWLTNGKGVPELTALVAKARYAAAGMTRAPKKTEKGDLILGTDLAANFSGFAAHFK